MESQLSRMNCQMFSTGLTRAFRRQRHERDVVREWKPVRDMPTGLIKEKDGMSPWRDRQPRFPPDAGPWPRCCSKVGRAPPPFLLRADGAENVGPRLVRWSCGAEGRVPRLAHRRVILFFCPIRASSANQISIGLPGASLRLIPPRGRGSFMGWPAPSAGGVIVAGNSKGQEKPDANSSSRNRSWQE